MAKAVMVVGLGFGDEGKGATVDYLTRVHDARLVVRFNGGAQAGHNVVTADGRDHCFSQFGSGTFAGARTHLARHVMVNPVSAIAEAACLESCDVASPFDGMTVEEYALVTTPFHIAVNRIREGNRVHRHGSCGMGVGETQEDALENPTAPWVIRAWQLQLGREALKSYLRAQQEHALEKVRKTVGSVGHIEDDGGTHSLSANLRILEDPASVDLICDRLMMFARQVKIVGEGWLQQQLSKPGVVIFEGAQGVLLDEHYGFHPHTTWSSCTFEAAERVIGGAEVEKERVGVLRAFHTRHGAGPFPSQIRVPEESGGLRSGRWMAEKRIGRLMEGEHNAQHPWQGDFRVGSFDVPLAMYAIGAVGGIDKLSVTCVDRVSAERQWQVCESYQLTAPPDNAASDFFEMHGSTVVDIKRPPRPNAMAVPSEQRVVLSRQEELGRRLSRVTHVPQSIPLDHTVGEQLFYMFGVPVIEAHGPTAKDRRMWR